MKQMILTGLSTEQNFGSPDPQFFLVFNGGELRVPIAAAAAEVVVQAMYSDPVPVDEDGMHPDPPDSDYDNEDSIPQA